MNTSPPARPPHLLPSPPAMRALRPARRARPGSPAVFAVGDLLQVAGQDYKIVSGPAGVSLQAASPPVIPVVAMGDVIQIEAHTYQLTAALTLKGQTPPPPAAGPLQISSYVDETGRSVHAAAPGQRVSILGQGFGSEAGTVSWMGQRLDPILWTDTRIDLVMDVAPPPTGWFTVVSRNGDYYSGLAFPIAPP